MAWGRPCGERARAGIGGPGGWTRLVARSDGMLPPAFTWAGGHGATRLWPSERNRRRHCRRRWIVEGLGEMRLGEEQAVRHARNALEILLRRSQIVVEIAEDDRRLFQQEALDL